MAKPLPGVLKTLTSSAMSESHSFQLIGRHGFSAASNTIGSPFVRRTTGTTCQPQYTVSLLLDEKTRSQLPNANSLWGFVFPAAATFAVNCSAREKQPSSGYIHEIRRDTPGLFVPVM